MRPFEDEDLEPGKERVARLLAAAFFSGFVGFVLGGAMSDEWPGAIIVALLATGPFFAMLFSLPRLAVASYIGRGVVAVVCFAAGVAAGDTEFGYEETRGLDFVVFFFSGCLFLGGGLVPLLVIRFFESLRGGK